MTPRSEENSANLERIVQEQGTIRQLTAALDDCVRDINARNRRVARAIKNLGGK
jgi:hypothetical protein